MGSDKPSSRPCCAQHLTAFRRVPDRFFFFFAFGYFASFPTLATANNASNNWGWPGLPSSASTASQAAGSYVPAANRSPWAISLDGYTNENSDGILPQKEAVDRDFRYYYRVVALELLLVHHGYRRCETASTDPGSLDELIEGLQDFQRSRNLDTGILQLDSAFWNELIVPVKLGDDSSAVLALQWLLTSTAEAARPPMWDAASVNRHKCKAIFTHDLEAKLLSRHGVAGTDEAQLIRHYGVQNETWATLLRAKEVRDCAGCNNRSVIARVFGIAWVMIWCGIAVVFAIVHNDGWCQDVAASADEDWRMVQKASPLACIDFFVHQVSKQTVPQFCRPMGVILAMMVSHNLAVLGVWSLPIDFFAHVLAGLVFTGGAIVAVRLASVHTPRSLPKQLAEVGAFAICNMGIYVGVLFIPARQRMWYAVLLAVMMAFWGLVTAGITDSDQRVTRGGLLFVMCIFTAALPTVLIIGAGMVTLDNGLWLTACVPTALLMLTIVNEYLGRLIVQRCAYTVETQWLLASIFRLCIELVRFNTALAVLLLMLFTESSILFLLLHLVQTFVFEVLIRQPLRNLCGQWSFSLAGVGQAEKNDVPFTAGEIVLRMDVDPWTYRSRAAMFPIEAVLFLTHLCQLLFMGLPVGVSHGNWLGGLVLIAFASLSREALAYFIATRTGKILPQMPWSKLPGHLIALMLGVGMVMSIFAQVSAFWLMYAHHWAACFIGGLEDYYVETEEDDEVAAAIVMAIIGAFVIGVVLSSFFSWAEWMTKVKTKQFGTMTAERLQAPKKNVVVVVHDDDVDASKNRISPKPLIDDVSPQASKSVPSVRELSDNLRQSDMTHESQEFMSHTWDQTLNSLWEQKRMETPLGDPTRSVNPAASVTSSSFTPATQSIPVPGVVEVETLDVSKPMDDDGLDDEWASAQRVPSKDLHLKLSMELLEKVAPQHLEEPLDKSIIQEEVQVQPEELARGETEMHKELLEQVFRELPADTSAKPEFKPGVPPKTPTKLPSQEPEQLLGTRPSSAVAPPSSHPTVEDHDEHNMTAEIEDLVAEWSMRDMDVKELLGDGQRQVSASGRSDRRDDAHDEGQVLGASQTANTADIHANECAEVEKSTTMDRILSTMEKTDDIDHLIEAIGDTIDDETLRGIADTMESCSTMAPTTAETAMAQTAGSKEFGGTTSRLQTSQTQPGIAPVLENEDSNLLRLAATAQDLESALKLSGSSEQNRDFANLEQVSMVTSEANEEATNRVIADTMVVNVLDTAATDQKNAELPTQGANASPKTADGLTVAESLEAEQKRAEQLKAAEEEEARRAAEEARRLQEEKELEEQIAAEEARRAAEEAAEEARRAAEEAARQEAERIAIEEAAAEVARLEAERLAREAATQAALDALQEAMVSTLPTAREDLERRLEEAQAIGGISEDILSEASRILNDRIVEENRVQAAQCLAQACMGRNIDELRLAIGRAKEARADEDLIESAVARLDELLAEVARREAASKRLREVLSRKVPEESSLDEIISALNMALQEAHTTGVGSAEREAGAERLQDLMQQKRREDATKAMEEALNSHDPVKVQAAIVEAKAAGVDAKEVHACERALEDLKDEIELANNKEMLLKRRIEHAMQAKDEAETAESSAEVEKLLGEHGIINALHEAIKEAKKTRMVRRGEIQKAEAVLPEVTADIKRILADKQAKERKLASERLRLDMDEAKRTTPVTYLVLDGLREAIAAAQVYRADTKDAEALLASLVAEHERVMQAAQDSLDRALSSKDVDAIRGGLQLCQSMRMSEVISRGLSQIRGIITEDIAVAQEMDSKEERLQLIARMEVLVGVLRAYGDKQLRHIHNSLQDLKGALRVFCRIRPLNSKETQRNDAVAAEMTDGFTVSVQRNERDRELFTYDAVFGPQNTQAEVFNEVRGLVQSVFDGYNVTIFTYGQTGSGKTWTVYGSGQEPGISPRACEAIFQTVARDQEKYHIQVKASMIELYLAELRDLLSTKDGPKLELRNIRQPDGTPTVKLEGATVEVVQSSDDLARVVAVGLQNRKVRSTDMNDSSSRSHLLLVIYVEVTDRENRSKSRSGKITIVDLAGSERLAKSGAIGHAAKEAIEINKSLTALGDVMMAFTSKAKMIPYRNHKLTQLMQDSLGGSAKTLMFVNVSPAEYNVDETVQSLKYASRARCIENDVSVNRSQAATPATSRMTPSRSSVPTPPRR